MQKGKNVLSIWDSPNDLVENTDIIAAARIAGIQYLEMWRTSDVADISQIILVFNRQLTFQISIETRALDNFLR